MIFWFIVLILILAALILTPIYFVNKVMRDYFSSPETSKYSSLAKSIQKKYKSIDYTEKYTVSDSIFQAYFNNISLFNHIFADVALVTAITSIAIMVLIGLSFILHSAF